MEASLHVHLWNQGHLEKQPRVARAIPTLWEAPRKWPKASLCKTSSGSVRLLHTWDSQLMHQIMLHLTNSLLLCEDKALQEKIWHHQEELVLLRATIKKSLLMTPKWTELSREKCMLIRPLTLLIQAQSAHREKWSRDKWIYSIQEDKSNYKSQHRLLTKVI